MTAASDNLLTLDPDDIAGAIPADEWAMWKRFATDLRTYADRIDAAFTTNLRRVQ